MKNGPNNIQGPSKIIIYIIRNYHSNSTVAGGFDELNWANNASKLFSKGNSRLQAASIFNGDDSYSQSLSFFLNKQFCCPYKRKR